MASEREEAIRRCLETAFPGSVFSIADESHLHAGHAGARSGMGHFALEITADAFNGLGPIERHRLVYAALGDLMQTDIHALRINARGSEG